MDSRLRRELGAIARDRSSGASELALRACSALQSWLGSGSNINRSDLLGVARSLLIVQPAMAPVLRLANEAALAADEPHPARYFARKLKSFSITLRTGSRRIARHFRSALQGRDNNALTTYSYSSTVLEAIIAARTRISQVVCGESRPGLEGRKTTRQILRRTKDVGVCLTTDAALHLYIASSRALVIGADSLDESGFTNKAGTGALVAYALEVGRPVWVLADTSKLLPRKIDAVCARRSGPDSEIWPGSPPRLTILNPYFERTPCREGVRILSEVGWMTPKQIRREIGNVRISPLLTAPSATIQRHCIDN